MVMTMEEAAVAAEAMCQWRKRGVQPQGWWEEVLWLLKSKNAPSPTSRPEQHQQPLSCISCRPYRATRCRFRGLRGRRMAMLCRSRRSRGRISTYCSDCSRCAPRLLNRRRFSLVATVYVFLFFSDTVTRASRHQTYVSSMIHRCVQLQRLSCILSRVHVSLVQFVASFYCAAHNTELIQHQEVAPQQAAAVIAAGGARPPLFSQRAPSCTIACR